MGIGWSLKLSYVEFDLGFATIIRTYKERDRDIIQGEYCIPKGGGSSGTSPDMRPVSIALAIPLIFLGDKQMAFELKNDQKATIGILVKNRQGETVTAPEGDKFSATSSDGAVLDVSVDGSSLVLEPRSANGTVTVTVTDANGLTPATLEVTISVDSAGSEIALDVDNAKVEAMPAAPKGGSI